MSGVGFTKDGAKRVATATKWVEGQRKNLMGQPLPRATGGGGQTNFMGQIKEDDHKLGPLEVNVDLYVVENGALGCVDIQDMVVKTAASQTKPR